MKKIPALLLSFALLLSLTACQGQDVETNEPSQTESEEQTNTGGTTEEVQNPENQQEYNDNNEDSEDETMEKEIKLQMMIGDSTVAVEWENNESVNALLDRVKDTPLTVQMSMYGGFEQVGSLGESLPRNDAQTTTQAGDIVLYSGNQIVVFYGSNSWAYTRLGRITDKTRQELADILGNGNVTLTLSAEEE